MRTSPLPLAVCLALVCVAAPALRGAECPALPSDFVLAPGQEVRLGHNSFSVRVEPHPDDASTLTVDLLARRLDPATGKVRRGSWLPHLRGRWVARRGATVRDGPLEFRLSPAGPSYGATLEAGPDREAGPLTLVLSVERRSGRSHRPRTTASPATGDCDPLPLDLTVAVPAGSTNARAAVGNQGAGTDRLDRLEKTSGALRFELLGSLSPSVFNYSDIWGWSDGTTFLAIIGARDGTYFVDVTEPSSPSVAGFIPGPASPWRDIKTYRDFAYIGTEGVGAGEGLQTVSLVDPANPVLVDTYTATFVTAHNLFVDEDRGHLWAVGTDDGTRVLTLEPSPEAPTEIGSWVDRYVHDAFVDRSTAYLSEVYDALQEIADATDPDSLLIVESFRTPGGLTHNCWTDETGSVLYTTDETPGGHVIAWDATGATSPPALLGEYIPAPGAIVHNALVDDEDDARVAVSHYSAGTRLVDFHRPELPVELGFYDDFVPADGGYEGVWGVYPYDPRGLIYASDIAQGLRVFRYVPTGGTLSGVVREAPGGPPVPGALLLSANMVHMSVKFQRMGTDGCLRRSDMDVCLAGFDPAEDWSQTRRLEDGMAEVGMTRPYEAVSFSGMGPVPLLAASYTGIGKASGLSLSLGVVPPSSFASPHYPEDGAQRYMVQEASILAVFPGAGLAYNFNRYLQVGATFLSGMTFVHIKQAARLNVQPNNPIRGNEDLGGDAQFDLKANDFFMPTGILGLMSSPADWLELGLSAKLPVNIEAKGKVKVKAPDLEEMDAVIAGDDSVVLRQNFPWVVRAGARYIHRYFDFEVDFVYEAWSQLKAFEVDFVDCVDNDFDACTHLETNTGPVALEDTIVPKNYRDTYSVRFGGDVAVWPGHVTLRAGGFYQTSAFPKDYSTMNVDFPFAEQIGVGGGLTWHAIQYLDLTAGYLHVFQPDVTVTDGIVQQQSNPIADQDGIPRVVGNVVNNGVYKVALNLFGVSFQGHF